MEADRPHPVRELLLVAALFLVYKVGRLAVAGDVGTAYANAVHLWTLERSLGLPSEAALQRLVLDHGWLVHGANLYYALVHFPATAAMLIWTYLRRPALYRWARTSLAALTAAGFAVQVLLPMAPPRLLALTGMVDTGHAVGPSVYSAPDTDTLANQYAAMPSLHVGWAAMVAIVLIAATGVSGAGCGCFTRCSPSPLAGPHRTASSRRRYQGLARPLDPASLSR